MTLSLPSASTVVTGVAIALVALSLSACGSTQNAAQADGERIESQLTSLDAAVDLTDAQTVRIREILTAQAANRPSGPPPRGGGQTGGVDPRAQQEAQRAAADSQIEAVLTEAQIEAFRTWRASQPQRPEGPPPGRR